MAKSPRTAHKAPHGRSASLDTLFDDSPGLASMKDPPLPVPTDIFTTSDIPLPSIRPLAVYAFDPSMGRFVGNYMTTSVRYEALEPGPVGERFAVIDYDGTNKILYKPVNLDDPKVMVGGGLDPTQSDPAVPPANGLCGRQRNAAAFRTCPRPAHPLETVQPITRDAKPSQKRVALPQHFPARHVPGQRLLQSRGARASVRLFQRQPYAAGPQFARPDDFHLPFTRHRRARNHARHR